MRKRALIKSIFLLLPVLALGLATTGDSVMVFDPAAGTTDYYSYFDLLPVAQVQLLLPLAGCLCAVVGLLAVVYLLRKKKGALKASGFVALAASVLAILPVISGTEVKTVPNVGVPILMFVYYFLANYWSGKEQPEAQGQEGPRLGK